MMRHDLEQNATPAPERHELPVSDETPRDELGAVAEGALPRNDAASRIRNRSRVPELVRAALGCPFA